MWAFASAIFDLKPTRHVDAAFVDLSPSRRVAKNAKREGLWRELQTLRIGPQAYLIAPIGDIRTAGEIRIQATRQKWPGALPSWFLGRHWMEPVCGRSQPA